MKKLFLLTALFLAVTVGTVSATSIKDLKSDLQFHIGAEGLWGHTRTDQDGGAFDVMIENYNMFDLPVCGGDFLSVGFMESFTGSFGGTTNWDGHGSSHFDKSKALGFDLIISPAFGIQFKEIVKLQMILGLEFRYEEFGVEWEGGGESVVKLPTLGIATGCQAKFLPNKFLSPVAGVRYSWTGMGEYYYNDEYSATDDDKDSHNCGLNTFLFNIGLSLNFGNK